jgi:hypothetical protein
MTIVEETIKNKELEDKEEIIVEDNHKFNRNT